MDKKNILVISYLFPPAGGIGVQRISGTVKYLKEMGYNPIVLTTLEKNYRIVDHSMENEIPEDLEIYRVDNAKEYSFSLFGRGINLNNLLLIPDGCYFWYRKAYALAMTIIEDRDIKLIYSTSWPYSAHLLALKLKLEKHNLKWIADFRDEWTTNSGNDYSFIKFITKNLFRMKIEKKMERDVCSNADRIIVVSDTMIKNIASNNSVSFDKFNVIHNGYDEELFKNNSYCQIHDGKFKILYTGSLYGYQRPDTFFGAVKNLLTSHKIEREKIVIEFIGSFSDWLKDMVGEYGLNDVVEVQPFREHKAIIRRMQEVNALLLIVGNFKNARNIHTGKIFEYIRSKTPIIALVPPDGVAAELINRTKTGFVCDYNDVEGIEIIIQTIYARYFNNDLNLEYSEEEISKYQRSALIKELCSILDQVYE